MEEVVKRRIAFDNKKKGHPVPKESGKKHTLEQIKKGAKKPLPNKLAEATKMAKSVERRSKDITQRVQVQKTLDRQAAHKAGNSPLARRRLANASPKAAPKVAKSLGSKVAGVAKSVAARFPKTAVGLAGIAGYKAGQKLNEKFGLSTKIVDALSKPYNPNAPVKSNKTTPKVAPAKSAPSKSTTPASKPVAKYSKDYTVYKKSSKEAGEFRKAFASAGGKEFTWQGRKYSGKKK